MICLQCFDTVGWAAGRAWGRLVEVGTGQSGWSGASQMVGVSASVHLPLHHKVQKLSSGTG